MDRIVRNFKIVEPLGNGTTGTVYKAIQLTLDRAVALKELHGHLSRDADFIRRFEREAKTAATLSHENILSVIDFGKEGDAYFIALEYVDGSDLKALMDGTKVPPDVATAIAIGMLRGLEHAHGRGIVHRDMKPANVMISREGTAKIADFSIAQATQLPSITVTGAMMGTPAYMSPEQVAGRPLDARTDLFSAGVILFEMLAGRRPFEGDSYPTVISQLLTITPPTLSEVDPAIPPEIAAVVRRALEKEPGRRFPNATEFCEALEAAAEAAKLRVSRSVIAAWARDPKGYRPSLVTRSLPPVAAPPRAAAPPPPRTPSSRAWLAVPVLAAVIGGGAWGGKTWLGRRGDTPTPAPTATALSLAAASGTPAPTPTPTPTSAPSAVVAAPTPKTSPARTPKVAARTPTPARTPEPTPTAVAVVAKGPGKLHVVAEPWAHVYIDNVKVDSTPMAVPIEIEAGTHVLKLQYSDFRPIVERIVVEPGQLIQKTIKFDARVRLTSNRVGDVYLGREHVGSTTTPFEVPPGRHTLVVRSGECADLSLPIEPKPGETLEKAVQLTCR